MNIVGAHHHSVFNLMDFNDKEQIFLMVTLQKEKMDSKRSSSLLYKRNDSLLTKIYDLESSNLK